MKHTEASSLIKSAFRSGLIVGVMGYVAMEGIVKLIAKFLMLD